MIKTKNKASQVFGTTVLVLFAFMIVISGCSTKKNEGQSPSPGQSPAPSQKVGSADAKKDFVEISWYMLKPIDNEKDQKEVEAEANKVIKEKINANLTFNFFDNASWQDKMKLMSAAGEPYDLVLTTSWTNSLNDNVAKGALLQLDDLLKKYGQDILKKTDPRAWKAVTYNGKIMAIPGQTPYTNPTSYVFKKDLVDKYKFDFKSVKSYKDLEPYLEMIKKNEPGITPLLLTSKDGPIGVLDYTPISPGVGFDEINKKVVLDIEMPGYLDKARTMYDFYKKGYIAKDAALKTDTLAEAKSGKYAVMRDRGGYTEDGSKSTAVYGFPTVETLNGYPYISTHNITSAATGISKTSKNPERAMMLVNLLYQDKQLINTLAFGIENKNYTFVSGKGTDHPVVKANSGAEQTWAIWHNWLGPLWDSWDSNWNTAKSLEMMQKNNKSAKESVLLGFTFQNETVKTEIAQLNAIKKEVEPIIFTGSMPDFDKYMAELSLKMKNAGVDKVKAEIEKQIAAWKAQK